MSEFKFLVELARRASRVVTHGKLARAVWGAQLMVQSHTLRVHVAAARPPVT